MANRHGNTIKPTGRDGINPDGVALGDTIWQGPQGRSVRTSECTSELSPWTASYVVACRDGKYRRVGTGIQPLAARIPRSVGLLLSRLESLGIDPEHLDRKMLAEVLRLARSNRVARLRAYGNSITIFVASEFIKAAMESLK
jgi:hypothetical protein